MNDSAARAELTDDDTDVYVVTSASGSVYRFDMVARTVERVGGGQRPPAAPADSLQPLRSIIEVRLGRPARFWLRNTSGGLTDPSEIWQHTSVVVSIRREDDAERCNKEHPAPLSE